MCGRTTKVHCKRCCERGGVQYRRKLKEVGWMESMTEAIGVRVCFFFFQAEDGIRDYKVTGVQTCALPISSSPPNTALLTNRKSPTSRVFSMLAEGMRNASTTNDLSTIQMSSAVPIAWLKAIGTALLIWIVLRSFVVEAFRIPSASMENTLLVGEFLFVNKAVFGGELEIPLTGIHCCRLPAFDTPKRDEVVVFRSVEDSTPDLNIVKRVIGAPGDTLQMVHDTVIRNGQRLDEPYALHTALSGPPDDQYRDRKSVV